MRATGIVRRIDDLGRVVIPKELRRTLRIRDGEPLEIFTGGEGEVIFRKYSPMGALDATARRVAEVLQRTAGLSVVVCDRDRAVAAAGLPKKEVLNRGVAPALDRIAEERRVWGGDTAGDLLPLEDCPLTAWAAAPVLAGGDIIGTVLFMGEAGRRPTEGELKLLAAGAGFLGREADD